MVPKAKVKKTAQGLWHAKLPWFIGAPGFMDCYFSTWGEAMHAVQAWTTPPF